MNARLRQAPLQALRQAVEQLQKRQVGPKTTA
jgi:hypothetical protein